MINEYNTIHEYGKDEIIIEKSTFIGYAKPINTEEEAVAFVNEIKKKHKDATHNVWAYTVGMNMEIQRYSDDGEPQGTAGIPTLEVIKKENLRNVVVVVTRYFGGIKLGAGGLVRAYTKGAKTGLDAGTIITKILFKDIRFKIDYTLLGKVQNEIMNLGYIIKEILYEDMVTIVVYSKLSEAEKIKEKIVDFTSGRVEIEEKEEFYLSELNGKVLFDSGGNCMNSVDIVREEMLQKKKWAVIGFTPDKNKFGYKIYKRLKEKGYIVYGINPRYDEIEGEKVYKSIKDLPEKVECVNMIVNPKLTSTALDEIKDEEIKYVWFQPGTFDEEVLDKAKNLEFDIVYHDCLYVELGRV